MKTEITTQLQINKAKLLLRKVLKVCEWEGSHGNLLMEDTDSKEPYWNGSEQGKLLNEIHKFLNSKANF